MRLRRTLLIRLVAVLGRGRGTTVSCPARALGVGWWSTGVEGLQRAGQLQREKQKKQQSLVSHTKHAPQHQQHR